MKQAKVLQFAAAILIATASMHVDAAEVLVGAISELTGAAADYGKSTTRGLQLGAEWLNSTADMAGNKIKLLVEDDATDKGQALSLLNTFAVRDQAAIIIGTSSSALAAAIAPRAEELKVPMITIAYSSVPLEGRQWIFKASDSIPRQFSAIGNYTADVIKPKTCVRAWNRDVDGYVSVANLWADIVRAKGVKVVEDMTFLLSDTDFTAAATKIASLKPDCLFIAMSPEAGANLLLQVKSAGLPTSTKIIGHTTMSTHYFLKAAGPAAEGAFTVAEYLPGGVNEMGHKFEAAYEAKYKEKPDNFAAAGFSEMLIIGAALKKVGPNPTRLTIRDAISGLKNVDTVIGRGKLTIVDRIAQYDMTILNVKGGNLVLAPGQ